MWIAQLLYILKCKIQHVHVAHVYVHVAHVHIHVAHVHVHVLHVAVFKGEDIN